MKMNKKGFTLIEMLVVIAIIAVLVAIVIPTVSSATDKAAAVANAANLRSVLAEATTKLLTDDTSASGNVTLTKAADGTYSAAATASCPKSAKCGSLAKDVTMTITINADKSVTCTYGTNTLQDFQDVADGTKAASTIVAATT